MGYYQELFITIKKPGVTGDALYLALSMKCPALFKLAEKYAGNDCDYGYDAEGVYLRLFGSSPMYNRRGIMYDKTIDLKLLSKDFECVIEAYYEGEDKEDAESITFDCGRVVEHKVLRWVDAGPEDLD